MESLDTGRYSLSKVGDEYVKVVIYVNRELTEAEEPVMLSYFSQFEGTVPVLVDRRGRYALSPGAQLALVKHARVLFSAIGFLDHSPLQRRITQIAGLTYLRELPVKSFPEIGPAEAWLRQFGPLPPFKTS